MKDAITVGKIQALFAALGTKASVAAQLGISRTTVSKYVAGAAATYKYARKTAPELKKRRRVMLGLLQKTCEKDGRKWPQYGSARAVQRGLQSLGYQISRRQVAREIKEKLRWKSYVRPKTPTRRVCDLERRKAFARRELLLDHRRLVFTDESWISCNEATSKRQFAQNRQDVLPREQKSRWNVPCAMVWTAIGYNYKGPLVIFPTKHSDSEQRCFRLDAASYRRRCLSRITNDLLARNLTLLHDGARSHAAGSTVNYLSNKSLPYVADFPPYSPDLNMIEPIWRIFQEKIGAHCPMNLDELVAAAKLEWERFPQEIINAHVDHFRSALKKCL